MEDADPLSTSISSAKMKGDVLEIDSDDGNESSYGNEKWHYDGKGNMKLLSSTGRDAFDDNIADQYADPKQGYAIPKDLTVPVAEFAQKFEAHQKRWSATTKKYLQTGGY